MKAQQVFKVKHLLIAAAMLVWASNAFAAYKIETSLKPNPPDAGDNTLQIKVTDEKGQLVDGANVHVLIFMPAMGTMPRMEEKAKVESKGNGLYVAQYDLSMGGTWEVVLTVEKEKSKEVFNYSLTTGVPGLTSKNETKAMQGQEGSGATNLLPIGPDRLQRIGVRFADAKQVSIKKMLRAVGVVESDNTKRSEIALRFPGYVEKQFVGRVGDHVEAGTPLFSVYSPDLVSAQSEFLLAHGTAGGTETLHTSTAERLKNLGLSARDISRIRKAGKPERTIAITAPQAGTILEVNVREGSSFAQGQLLYSVGDLSKNYIVARIFQRDLSDLKVGQSVEIILPESEEESYRGKIDLIYPNISEGEGTANVRVVPDEGNLTLKPGIYVDLRFPIEFGERLAIPTKAVLYSGLHKYVFVDRGEGVLEPREIKTGKVTDDFAEVKTGLKEGERVVASGSFLISSEAQLRSALPKWEVPEGNVKHSSEQVGQDGKTPKP